MVALLDLRPVDVPLVDAVPFSSRVVLLALVLMAGPVWLPVTVVVVVVVPAMPVESVLLAVVEVIHVVFHLVLLAIHGQGENIGSLARPVVVEVLILVRPVGLEASVGVPVPVLHVEVVADAASRLVCLPVPCLCVVA